ncbi:hypothetical protein [Chloroflexus aurantiacus]
MTELAERQGELIELPETATTHVACHYEIVQDRAFCARSLDNSFLASCERAANVPGYPREVALPHNPDHASERTSNPEYNHAMDQRVAEI